MRLPDFILANVEPILMEWEVFARSIWPGLPVDPVTLRDDAEAILRATVSDMRSAQTLAQQADKSKGGSARDAAGRSVNEASVSHGALRVGSGFELAAVVAEYRALRASVLRLWRASGPIPDLHDVDDITRFNESIDQSLTEAVHSFTERLNRDREAILHSEQASRTEAEAANRAKDMFLATLGHEMRTPLNAIVGWLSILRNEGAGENDFREGIEVIERNTKAQVQLIDDLLDISRILSGKLRVDVSPCELSELIQAGVDVMRPAAEARGIMLDVQLEPSASPTSCDPTRIQQVVWNLLSNAVKFTPKGGRIGVALAREQSNLRIQVSDTGEGIKPELLPYIFDRFRQSDSSTRRRHGGLGLGLSIVKYLVEAHGGTVEADSAGEGRGATFTVRLPIRAVRIDDDEDAAADSSPQTSGAGERDAKTGAGRASRSPVVRLDGVRVLVVDDEADARRLLVKVLQEAGAIVTAAASAAEALDMLARDKPNVLVSDLGMAGQDGFDLIREVRRRGHDARDLPAVALTAFVQKDDQRLSLEAGFQLHVSKPVDPHDLTSVIARLAGRPG
jgi:signal transduction histidine kinase